MRRLTVLAAAALCGVGAVWLLTASAARDRINKANEPFLELPYLQLGDSARLADPESLTLLWQTQTATGRWTVEVKTGDQFTATAAPVRTEVPLAGNESFQIWQARLAGLTPGMRFDYRVLLDGKEVFSAGAKGRAPAAQPYKFAVWGDSGADTPEQRQIAVMADRFNPDFVFITGDIVYSRGQVHEYRTKYFPIYNAPRSDVKLGAPLIRSIPFIAAPGNHDLGNRDLGAHPGGLAYFLFWRQPLNGPDSQVFGKLEGPADRQQAFRAASEQIIGHQPEQK